MAPLPTPRMIGTVAMEPTLGHVPDPVCAPVPSIGVAVLLHNWVPMNEVYNTFFPEPRPVRSYFGATGFRRRGQLLQIDCIAYVD